MAEKRGPFDVLSTGLISNMALTGKGRDILTEMKAEPFFSFLFFFTFFVCALHLNLYLKKYVFFSEAKYSVILANYTCDLTLFLLVNSSLSWAFSSCATASFSCSNSISPLDTAIVDLWVKIVASKSRFVVFSDSKLESDGVSLFSSKERCTDWSSFCRSDTLFAEHSSSLWSREHFSSAVVRFFLDSSFSFLSLSEIGQKHQVQHVSPKEERKYEGPEEGRKNGMNEARNKGREA